MICPRCRVDTTLWIQKISQDKLETKTGKVTEEGKKTFICAPCKSDWISLSALFKAYWKKIRKRSISDDDYEFLYSMFLKSKFKDAVDRRKYAQVYVGIIAEPLTKREAVHLQEADLLTSEDYAWVAGVIDALGKVQVHENPGKICLLMRHENKMLLERVRSLVGGNVTEVRGIWSYTTTRKNSEAALKRLDPYFRCSKDIHPEEVSDDDRMLAWIAGYAQALGKKGVITSSCKWAIRLMGTLFPGVETASGKEYSFAPEEDMRKRLMIFIERKIDSDATIKNPRKAEAFLYPAGVQGNQGVPRGSRFPYPSGPKPNSVPGPNPGVEGLRPASPKPMSPTPTPSVWEVPSPPPDPTPEIEVSGDTQVRLSLSGENCLVCRLMYEDLGKDKGFLKGSKQISLLGKLNHLYAEFEVTLPSECPECAELVPLRLWSESFDMCGFCKECSTAEGKKELVDDKKWASV